MIRRLTADVYDPDWNPEQSHQNTQQHSEPNRDAEVLFVKDGCQRDCPGIGDEDVGDSHKFSAGMVTNEHHQPVKDQQYHANGQSQQTAQVEDLVEVGGIPNQAQGGIYTSMDVNPAQYAENRPDEDRIEEVIGCVENFQRESGTGLFDLAMWGLGLVFIV